MDDGAWDVLGAKLTDGAPDGTPDGVRDGANETDGAPDGAPLGVRDGASDTDGDGVGPCRLFFFPFPPPPIINSRSISISSPL